MKRSATPRSCSVHNHIAELRAKRNLSVAALAKAVGVSRQTVYAMEQGDYVPNTAVALQMARALEVSVEQVFALPDQPAVQSDFQRAALLPDTVPPRPGQLVQLCKIGRRHIAIPTAPPVWYLPASDAVVSTTSQTGSVQVQTLPHNEPTNRLLVAGCDPALSLLGRRLLSHNAELVLVHRNSSQALELLKRGLVHVAGTHFGGESTSSEFNVDAIQRTFRSGSVAAVSMAIWEEGLVVQAGNPKNIRSVNDLVRRGVRFLNREAGAGSRRLLDRQLEMHGIKGQQISGYNQTAPGHLAAAWTVHSDAADCCIATNAAAQVFGLEFLPLARSRFDLVVRKEHLHEPVVQMLFDSLTSANLRGELAQIGYSTDVAGSRVL